MFIWLSMVYWWTYFYVTIHGGIMVNLGFQLAELMWNALSISPTVSWLHLWGHLSTQWSISKWRTESTSWIWAVAFNGPALGWKRKLKKEETPRIPLSKCIFFWHCQQWVSDSFFFSLEMMQTWVVILQEASALHWGYITGPSCSVWGFSFLNGVPKIFCAYQPEMAIVELSIPWMRETV